MPEPDGQRPLTSDLHSVAPTRFWTAIRAVDPGLPRPDEQASRPGLQEFQVGDPDGSDKSGRAVGDGVMNIGRIRDPEDRTVAPDAHSSPGLPAGLQSPIPVDRVVLDVEGTGAGVEVQFDRGLPIRLLHSAELGRDGSSWPLQSETGLRDIRLSGMIRQRDMYRVAEPSQSGSFAEPESDAPILDRRSRSVRRGRQPGGDAGQHQEVATIHHANLFSWGSLD